MTPHRLSTYSYGKDDVRILRIVRDPKHPRAHQVVEYTIQCLLSGSSLDTSYTEADNSSVVATDSIKNTINLLAKISTPDQVLCPELFSLVIVEHFLRTYSHIDTVEVTLEQLKWSRIALAGENGLANSSGKSSTVALDEVSPLQLHPHSFVRDGEDRRTVYVEGKRDAQKQPIVHQLQGGLRDLRVLKSSGSAFYGFWRDEYTTLPEVQDRIFSTTVVCSYGIQLPEEPLSDLVGNKTSILPPFDDIARAATSHILTTFCTHESPSVQATMYQSGQAILDDKSAQALQNVQLTMPNRHYIPIDLSWAKVENTKEDEAEVFLPSAHPSGLIKAEISRS